MGGISGEGSNASVDGPSAPDARGRAHGRGVREELTLLRIASTATSRGIDFSPRINYQRRLQTSLRRTGGKVMFSFQWSLLAMALALRRGPRVRQVEAAPEQGPPAPDYPSSPWPRRLGTVWGLCTAGLTWCSAGICGRSARPWGGRKRNYGRASLGYL